MKNAKSVSCAAMLVLALSAPTFAKSGTISGTKSGTISGTRAGTISGTRSGTISGTRTSTVSEPSGGIIPTASTVDWIKIGLFQLSTVFRIW